MKTQMGILAGRTAHFILSKMGRGSTLPGKIALKYDATILDTLAKDYEIVVITGTNGKTLTTALTVGILKEAFGDIVTNPSGANMITGITSTFLTAKPGKSGKNRSLRNRRSKSTKDHRIYHAKSFCFYQHFPRPNGSLWRDIYYL